MKLQPFEWSHTCCTTWSLEILEYMILKVCGLHVGPLLNQTPVFEWYMARLGPKIGHQKGTSYNEIMEICAQTIDTSSGFHSQPHTCDHLKRKRILSNSTFNIPCSILKSEMKFFMIANQMRQFQPNFMTTLFVKLEVPVMVTSTLPFKF